MDNDNSNTEEQVNTEQKQTNKTFTQSEQDKAIAEAVQRATSQFGDYNDKIKELETLKKATLERERAEMSELEQAREMLKEAENKVISLSSENMEFKKTTIKNNVLNNSKYSNLPTCI
jgi:cob(I)alamin adenosyltransferase